MNEKNNSRFIIAIIILSVVLSVSIGFNIGLGRSYSDNQQLRENERKLNITIEQLTAEREYERNKTAELRELNREANDIIRQALDTAAGNIPNYARANEIIRSVIEALHNLEVLYNRGNGSRDNRMDTLGGG